jgi:hypothetical protein
MLCQAAEIPDAAAKVAAYVASRQPEPRQKYPRVDASEIEVARGDRPAIQWEVTANG